MKRENFELIIKIAKRAEENGLLMFDRMSLIMDLECAKEEFNLRLDDFLNADNFNFSHDIYGIQSNLNRQTKKMENFFLPRFTSRD
ncbi:hypothetical protein G9F71_008450 [Clostridium sp. FP2]|uniref:DUF6874 family protein n=1 Tax=Clostridium sp. FP2 TaxID=2724481 RepID=UPI0013E90FFC|nr:hypothetical protein [Clostridium sp. FP2]MBZ9622882.1 hypothetical protein [Clostridium sp. FP2]